MQKNVNKGFMLVETLVVTTFVFSVLMVLYIQFKSIDNSYSRSFRYNMPNSLYKVNGVKEYMNKIGFSSLETALVGNYYVDFSTCSATYVNDVSYCTDLFKKMGITKIIFTKEDISDLKTILVTNRIFNEEFNLFVEHIKFEEVEDEFRIIAEFEDGTFASLKL